MSKRQLKLGAFLMASGHHLAAWRHPRAWAGGGVDFEHFKRLAQTAERGKFDAIFFADNLALLGPPSLASLGANGDVLDPLILLTALAGVTQHLGLISTVSTSYNDPYLLARRFASLDHISGGRAGWNLVTSATDAEAQNFGLEQNAQHGDRYARAESVGQLRR
jgi:alkanesulfonate monooxygenase SsuD/methylene tetrahydromethanopterin reductase-like flavin-dependent oxidoreductase (luciferase family)